MKTLIASVVAVVVALVGCSSADQAAPPAPCAAATSDAPSSSTAAQQGAGKEGGAGADASASPQKTTDLTLVERCKDDLTCTIGGGDGPVADGTARLRSLAGECFFTLQWGSDTFTHKLEPGGVTDDTGKWVSDTQHVVVTYGGGITVEDCSLP